MSFERAVEMVLQLEGEWSDHPNDAGERTRWGISSRAYPQLDLSLLTRKQAIAIYRRDYWRKARCERLPAALGLAIFDAAVHGGVTSAVELLQGVVAAERDGVIGPQTLAALRRYGEEKALRLFLQVRTRALLELSERPGQGVFRLGWMNRVMRIALECGALREKP